MLVSLLFCFSLILNAFGCLLWASARVVQFCFVGHLSMWLFAIIGCLLCVWERVKHAKSAFVIVLCYVVLQQNICCAYGNWIDK